MDADKGNSAKRIDIYIIEMMNRSSLNSVARSVSMSSKRYTYEFKKRPLSKFQRGGILSDKLSIVPGILGQSVIKK